jgi:hypothetical protein
VLGDGIGAAVVQKLSTKDLDIAEHDVSIVLYKNFHERLPGEEQHMPGVVSVHETILVRQYVPSTAQAAAALPREVTAKPVAAQLIG